MLMHSIMDPTVGTFAGSIVELTDVLTEDILIPTEDILIPLRIPTASDNILVRFTVGITRPAQTIPLLHRSSVLLLTTEAVRDRKIRALLAEGFQRIDDAFAARIRQGSRRKLTFDIVSEFRASKMKSPSPSKNP